MRMAWRHQVFPDAEIVRVLGFRITNALVMGRPQSIMPRLCALRGSREVAPSLFHLRNCRRAGRCDARDLFAAAAARAIDRTQRWGRECFAKFCDALCS